MCNKVYKVTPWVRQAWESNNDVADLPGPKGVEDWEAMPREMFSRLYSFPRRVEDPDPTHERMWKTLEGLPDWESLRATTRGSAAMSAAAVSTLLDSLLPVLAEDRSEDQSFDDWFDAATADGNRNAVRAAVRAGIAKAAEEAEEATGLLSGLGWSREPGMPGPGSSDLANAKRVSARLDVKLFLRLVGRLKGLANEVRTNRSDLGGVVLDGTTTGKDVGRMLPTDALYLAGDDDPELAEAMETLWLRRYAEGTLGVYSLKPPGKKDRGPVVIALDASGSMEGQPWTCAQALSMACAELARQEKRGVSGFAFESQPGEVMDLTRVDGSARFVTSTVPSGGTNFNLAIATGVAVAGKIPGADLLIITDGACSISDQTKTLLAESGCRLHVVLVPGGYAGSLEAVAKTVVTIDDLLRPDSAAKDVFRALL